LTTVLRGEPVRKPVVNADTNCDLSGLGFRVLAFGLPPCL